MGAGVSGLCAGFELKKVGLNVRILEASSRVGGRVVTFRDPKFAPGLHAEGGAMRIPQDHFLLHKYIDDFGLKTQLFDFEMQNRFIYLTGYPMSHPERLTYENFNALLKRKDEGLLSLFPDLKEHEKGKTCDELFSEATLPVVHDFWKAYDACDPTPGTLGEVADKDKIIRAYETITLKYDQYTLRSYLTDVAKWSQDAVNLYDLGNAHVVFENGFIESFKDAFLSSNKGGNKAGMQQLQNGMDTVPKAFISSDRGNDSLIDNITFGARVNHIGLHDRGQIGIPSQDLFRVTYETPSGKHVAVDSDFLILAIPYTAQRAITKARSFDPKQEMAIRDVRYVEVTKVLLQYKTRWWEAIYNKETGFPDGGLVTDLPIRYTMFPHVKGNESLAKTKRGVIMAAYVFEQDATQLGAASPARRVRMAAENLDRIFPEANSLDLLEADASQVFPADELAGGSAFCYFGPMQKTEFLPTMMESDWARRVFFAGEQASFTHGWIQGALEAGLRCVQQVYAAASRPIQ